jgi:hypothetical protein
LNASTLITSSAPDEIPEVILAAKTRESLVFVHAPRIPETGVDRHLEKAVRLPLVSGERMKAGDVIEHIEVFGSNDLEHLPADIDRRLVLLRPVGLIEQRFERIVVAQLVLRLLSACRRSGCEHE